MAKRMVLVDPATMILKTSPVPNPTSETFMQIDADMKNILDTTTMSQHEKVKAYQQALRQYLIKAEQLENRVRDVQPKVRFESTPTIKSEPMLETDKIVKMERRIVDNLPKTMQNKGQILLDYIRDMTDLNWNERGELLFNNQPLAGSNISDLVNETLRPRKLSSEPTGWTSYVNALKASNIPQDLIGNKLRWDGTRGKEPSPTVTSPKTLGTQGRSVKKKKTATSWLTL